MFDVGFTELLLVFVIGLLILGPERLPRVAAQLGRWVGKARRTANQLRYQLEREVALEEVYRAPKKKPPQRPTAPGTNEDSAPGTNGSGAPGPGTDQGASTEASSASASAAVNESTPAAAPPAGTASARTSGPPEAEAADRATSSVEPAASRGPADGAVDVAREDEVRHSGSAR